MSTTLPGEGVTDNLAPLPVAEELQQLAIDIREQNLAEAHSRTIREGWVKIGELGDALDMRSGVTRDMNHGIAIDLAWAQLLKEGGDSDESFSPQDLYERMVLANHQFLKSQYLDMMDDAKAQNPEIGDEPVQHLKMALNNLLKSYGLTDILRSNLATKIDVALSTVNMPPHADLLVSYKRKLGIRHDRKNRTETSHPVVLNAAGYFEGRASAEIRAYLKSLELDQEVGDIKALLKAGSLMSLSNIRGKERNEIKVLRTQYFAALLKGEVTDALQILEELILVEPAVGTRATYDLLGLDDQARQDMMQYHRDEAKVKKINPQRFSFDLQQMISQEKEVYGKWLGEHIDELQGKICELMDEDGQPTGKVLQLHERRIDRHDAGGRPAIGKYHYDIYLSDDGKLIFSRHIAGYFRASTLAALMEDGRLSFYDSLDAYMAARYPEAAGFEEIKDKGSYSETTMTERVEKYGAPLMAGWLLGTSRSS